MISSPGSSRALNQCPWTKGLKSPSFSFLGYRTGIVTVASNVRMRLI